MLQRGAKEPASDRDGLAGRNSRTSGERRGHVPVHFVTAVFEASGPEISKQRSCRKVLGIAEAVPLVARSEHDILQRHRDFAALDEMNAAAFQDSDADRGVKAIGEGRPQPSAC